MKAKRFLEIRNLFGDAHNLSKLIVLIVRLIKMITFLNLHKTLVHVGKKDKKGREQGSVDLYYCITD